MTTKTATSRLAASDKLLSSTILLPKDALISCFIYSPLAGPSSHSRAYNDILELARREVLAQNHDRATTLTRSILTSLHIRGSDSCMYAFHIGTQGQAPTELAALHFDGLVGTSVSVRPGRLLPFWGVYASGGVCKAPPIPGTLPLGILCRFISLTYFSSNITSIVHTIGHLSLLFIVCRPRDTMLGLLGNRASTPPVYPCHIQSLSRSRPPAPHRRHFRCVKLQAIWPQTPR